MVRQISVGSQTGEVFRRLEGLVATRDSFAALVVSKDFSRIDPPFEKVELITFKSAPNGTSCSFDG